MEASKNIPYFTQSLKKKEKPRLTIMQKLKAALLKFEAVKHSHDRENARRRRQIDRGIIRVNA